MKEKLIQTQADLAKVLYENDISFSLRDLRSPRTCLLGVQFETELTKKK